MTQADYVVCIPSYKRAQICNDKTLTVLKQHKIPSDHIYVYVANKDEEAEYKKLLDPALYGKIIVGKKGITQQRRFIKESWPEGKHVVSLDDDITKIDLSLSPMFRGKSLDYFIKCAFEECKKQGAYIWGVYPVFNPFFRKGRPEMTTHLTFIVGCFYGYINRPKLACLNTPLTAKQGDKEDVELSIKYFIKDGIVLRFNRIGFETKYFGTSGGIGRFDERLKTMSAAAKTLKAHYPDYGTISVRKNGMTEFKLRRIPAKNITMKKRESRESKESKEKIEK